MSTIVIRDYQSQDAPGVALLQNDVDSELQLSSEQFLSEWGWFGHSNPAGPPKALVATDAKGTIVAHEAVVPFMATKDGRPLVAGLPCQLVVTRSLRNTPLFLQLEMQLLSQYQQAGIDFVCGPVRDHVLRAHLVMGFRAVGSLPVYARPYRLSRLARHYLGRGVQYAAVKTLLRLAELPLQFFPHRRSRGINVVPVETFDTRTAAEIEHLCSQLGLHALRTAAVLNWRFFQCPDRSYLVFVARNAGQCLGYVALRRMPMHEFDTLAIVDLVFPSARPDVGRALLAAVHDRAVGMQVDLAVCMFNANSPLIPVLRRCGFLRTSEAFTIIVHQPKDASFRVDMETLKNWHYTWFEHDYV
jgi:hypothetical protein